MNGKAATVIKSAINNLFISFLLLKLFQFFTEKLLSTYSGEEGENVTREVDQYRLYRVNFTKTMLAKHFMIEMHDCVSTALNDPQAIHDALTSVADLMGVKVIKTTQHLFDPHGITCLFLVSSSHYALHSWPEHKFITVDLFVCDDGLPMNECIEQLKKVFEPSRTEVSILECGEEY
jgi:S-adenosylmethionine decarboxylase proenzyme